MNIESIIKKCKFIDISKRKIEIDENNTIEYYYCHKGVEEKENSDIIQTIPFASYFIIDLTDEKTYEICRKSILYSFESFISFQEKYLSNKFFLESTKMRYNIYLMFVCDNTANLLYRKISDDLNYARKIFLNTAQFEEYFCFWESTKNFIKDEYSKQYNVVDDIKDLLEYLHEKKAKSILLSSEELGKKPQVLVDFLQSSQKTKNFDKYCNINLQEKEFMSKYLYMSYNTKNSKEYSIKNIDRIILNNFRTNCFNELQEIEAGKINILYGENASGKSSILDAIEFGFTGKNHKNPKDPLLENAIVTIVGREKNKITSKTAIEKEFELKQIWYENKIGDLNELFCRVNYFDTDTTYRFAIEEGDIKDSIFHIRKLLCNAKLLELEATLKRRVKEIALFENFTFGFYSKIKTKKRKSIFKLLKGHTFEDIMFKENIEKEKHKLTESVSEMKETCEYSLTKIGDMMDRQIEISMGLINKIFHKLYSYNYDVSWKENSLAIKSLCNDNSSEINTMSTAQKVCLALSVIFAQFLISEKAPRIILLDESVANFDSQHLLNLLDFIRDLVVNDIQVFFTTANDEIAKVANNKFSFLKEEFCVYQIGKDDEAKADIKKREF